jgi:hypothetical protein
MTKAKTIEVNGSQYKLGDCFKQNDCKIFVKNGEVISQEVNKLMFVNQDEDENLIIKEVSRDVREENKEQLLQRVLKDLYL